MPISHAIWAVGEEPNEISKGILPSEQLLEEMIVAKPRILSDEWMLVGRQISTDFAGRIDLLAVAPDGSLVLVELKRDKTPREVVAQALDYASWLEGIESDDIRRIYKNFKPYGDLATDFQNKFQQELDEDSLNGSHQIVIVASSLDASSERIVNYLNNRGIAINVLFFEVFEHKGDQLLSRAWLIDPSEIQVSSSGTIKRSENEPWNGEFYVSFGHAEQRNWDEAREYNFICGGGGTWYSNSLRMLSEGDRIWVKVPKIGYVGVGRVTGPRISAEDFEIDGRPALDTLTKAKYHRENLGNAETMEYFVPVEWIKTVALNNAVQEVGLFGNQNTVCKPITKKWRETVTILKERFGLD